MARDVGSIPLGPLRAYCVSITNGKETMNKRYRHSYGGVCTEVGTFLPKELVDYFNGSGHESWAESLKQSLKVAPKGQPMKVLDIIQDSREVLVYSTTTDYFRLEVINR